ncbi:MAG: hypothetical protein Q8J69_06990 [Sphingobacteriaceae bacterium]|nr:hypothetical protein [Sphingobacteriaceae bacterium]
MKPIATVASLSLLLLLLPLWLVWAQPVSNNAVQVDFQQLQSLLLSEDVASKVATTDSLGRRGIYLIPQKELEWVAFQRPNPDTLSLYSFYPEEIWWYQVRHWLEIIELKEKNDELSIRFQSRQPGVAVKPDYLIHLRFRRSYEGWSLISKKIYEMD